MKLPAITWLFIAISVLSSCNQEAKFPSNVPQKSKILVYDSTGSQYEKAPDELFREIAETALNRKDLKTAEENYKKVLSEYSKFIANQRHEYDFKLSSGSMYYHLWKVYFTQGKYVEAAEAATKAAELKKHRFGMLDWCRHYLALWDVYSARGDYVKALRAIQDAQDAFAHKESNMVASPFEFLSSRLGEHYLLQGDYEKSKVSYRECLNYWLQTPADKQDIATAMNDLAKPYYYSDDIIEAEKLLHQAAGHNGSAAVPFETDLANSLTMLGKISGRRGKDAEALNYFKSAIGVLGSFEGNRIDKSDVWYEIGRFQLRQGKSVDARSAFSETLKLRQATATATHPNYADAVKGLADICAAESNFTSATLQAEEALKILDTALVPTHPRIAPTLIALATLNILSSKPDLTRSFNDRIDTILQKPLGPWKEDFMDTAAYYEKFLTKAGKAPEADRLHQLQIRQKDRP